MSPPYRTILKARIAQKWLASGAAVRAGEEDIPRVVEAGIEAILAPVNEQRALEPGLIVHLRTGDTSGVYRAYERGWRDGRTFEGEPRCLSCRDTQRVEARGAGWVRCPECAPIVHLLDDSKAGRRCGIVAGGASTAEESIVTCPDCLHKMAEPSDAEMRMARWVGRAIAYLRAAAPADTIHDVNRTELLADADAIWKGEDPDEWDKAILHAAGRARCVCGRSKDELLTAGHVPGCAYANRAADG